jgi:hypothetical protein
MANPIHAHFAHDLALIGDFSLKTKYIIQPASGIKSESQFKPVEGSSSSAEFNTALLGCVGVTALPQYGHTVASSGTVAPHVLHLVDII